MSSIWLRALAGTFMAFLSAPSAPRLHAAAAQAECGELLLVGESPQRCNLTGIGSNDSASFQSDDGKAIEVELRQIVRWRAPSVPRIRDELLLTDGTRLTLAATWGASPSVELHGKDLKARTKSCGVVELGRSQIRAALWQLPPDEAAGQKVVDMLLSRGSSPAGEDRLSLDSGDVLKGRLTAIASDEAGQQHVPVATFNSRVGELKLPLSRIRGLVFSTAPDFAASRDQRPALMVGLRDGSVLAAQSLTARSELVVIKSDSAGDLTAPLKDVVLLQSFDEHIAYLSDMKPAAYQDEPFLDLHWPFRRDRNVDGELLQVHGRSHLKGLGMHSTARLAYHLDGSYDRFAAEAAIDDAAEGAGSVEFRVMLHQDGQWQEAFASPIVRGGDPPIPIAVDVSKADQLALIVEYADHGDERDYADWLDARLERTSKQPTP